MRLKDKVAIVTGTRTGIGKAIALRFAGEGAKVVTCIRSGVGGEDTSGEIKAAGGDALFVQCDVSLEQDVIRAVRLAIEKYGRLDIIVNNAGVNFVKPFLETNTADWDRVINTDLRGTYFFCRYGIMQMLKNGGGSIINITSVHTMAGLPESAPYDAAKWGVVGMTKSLAVEFASRNIRVNALSPGLIDTQIWKDIISAAPNPEECKQYWASNIPAGRPGFSEEIAAAAVFLASDEASYCTGSNIVIDGGMTAQLVSRQGFESGALEGGTRRHLREEALIQKGSESYG
ncbi:MAG: SDR family oxidoreductase [Treponema sp.]|jgi:NAD(P)-dependent dehydrogenase (short-subunit alcohol dehydrogenase family)|nr:SDR family oxidoreductase [Treponema sp.]